MHRALVTFLLLAACAPDRAPNPNPTAADAYREAAMELPAGSPGRERLLAKADRLAAPAPTATAAPVDPLVVVENAPTPTLEEQPQPAATAAPVPAPPAPEAVPAPTAPAEAAKDKSVLVTYLIGFGWNRDTLDKDAEEVIGDALTDAHNVDRFDIVVNGHTDTSGSQDYNLALSQRRADHVAARLKRGGVPEEKIATYAFGETDPKVATADGVREAANRRVEIVIE